MSSNNVGDYQPFKGKNLNRESVAFFISFFLFFFLRKTLQKFLEEFLYEKVKCGLKLFLHKMHFLVPFSHEHFEVLMYRKTVILLEFFTLCLSGP